MVTDGPLDEGDYRLTITPSLTDVVGNRWTATAMASGEIPSFARSRSTFLRASPSKVVSNASRESATELLLDRNPGRQRSFSLGFGRRFDRSGRDEDWWSFEALAGDRIAVAVDCSLGL